MDRKNVGYYSIGVACLTALAVGYGWIESRTLSSGLRSPSFASNPQLSYKESYQEWYAERAYPNKEVDWSAWPRAFEHIEQMPTIVRDGTANWVFMGPTNLPAPYRIYYGQGTMNGRVNDIAVSPHDTDTLYLASATGGAWKSTNRGVTWTSLSDSWPSLATSSVCGHPKVSGLVFVGTGDFNGGYPYSFGLMRSTDGGNTWTNIGASQFGNVAIRRIVSSPDDSSIMLIATGKGSAYWGYLWRSLDQGQSWTIALNQLAAWTDIEFGARPATGTRWCYASGLDNGGQLWRSNDQGSTWTKLAPPLGTAFQNGLEVAASRIDPNTVYLLSGTNRKIFKSVDAGTTWTDITAGFPNGTNNYNWSQSSYDFSIETGVREVNGQQIADLVYVGLIDVVQSIDSGATWRSLGLTYTSGALTHNDQHLIRTNLKLGAMVANDGGIYHLNYNHVDNTWSFDTSLNRFLGITQFYQGDFHPTDINRMIAGTQDNATPASIGDLQNWKNVGGGDGGFAAIRQDNPSVQYATSQNLGVYRTTNNWTSSTGISPNVGTDRVAFIAPIVLQPDNQNFLFAGTNYLWRYSQSANTWTARLGGQSLSVSGTIRSIGIAPSNGNIIYTGSNNGELWMTQNGGTTWTQINTGSPSLPNRFIRCIAVDPTNPNKIFVAVSGTGTAHIWRCDDTTAPTRVWTSIDSSGTIGLPNLPAQTIALDPANPSTSMVVGMDLGVYQTDNGGASWFNIGTPQGLPNVQVNSLKWVPGANSIYAITWGRGIWRLPLSGSRPPGGPGSRR